jgi:enediyne biosynthesis protein E4
VTKPWGSLRLGVVIGFVVAAASAAAIIWSKGCAKEAPKPASRPAGTYSAPPAIPDVDDPPPKMTYVDVTRASGVDFVHETGARGKKLLPETMGAGCAFFDYDGDGDSDLLLLNGDLWSDDPKRSGARPSSRLYRNDGGWKFADVTKDAGLDAAFYAMGCSAADTDGDADLDLFVSGVGGYRFFRNDGGKFVEMSAEAGLVPGGWKDSEGREHGCFATSAAFLDYDVDGRPDLFVCHYVRWSEETDVWSTMDGKTKSYAIPTQYQGESCRLWRNLGGNKFEDATDKARVRNDEGKSLGVCVFDLEDDGFPDVAIANDTQPNYLYRNNKDGTFTDIGLDCGIAYGPDGRARAGMGIHCAPVCGDARLAMAIGNFSGEPVSLFEQLAGKPGIMINKADQYGVAVVTHPMLTFGVLFLDADQDGWTDLLLANGHIEPTIQAVHKETPYKQPMQLLRNVKGKRFTDVSKSVGGDFVAPRVGRALAYADVDGDGDLDLCETVNGGPPALLRCDGPERRAVRVSLRGKAPATDALGAKVTLVCGDRQPSQRVRTGGSYLSTSETALTFALPDGVAASRIVVTWRAGAEQSFDGPFPGGTRVTIDEASGLMRN